MVEWPQVRDACAPFTSRLFRRRKRFVAAEPLQALVIGAFVRGLSMRDVESLCEEAGLGQVSKSTASRLCRELKERFQAFRERDLSSLRLVCLFRRGLPAPRAGRRRRRPGLVDAIEQLWPHSNRQRCTVHRLRNLLAKLLEVERERVKAAYWRALDAASSQTDGERRLRELVGELADSGYTAAAA